MWINPVLKTLNLIVGCPCATYEPWPGTAQAGLGFSICILQLKCCFANSALHNAFWEVYSA